MIGIGWSDLSSGTVAAVVYNPTPHGGCSACIRIWVTGFDLS